jgi:hypothetical protein
MRGVKEDSNFRNGKKNTWRCVGTNDFKALLFQKTDSALPLVMCGCKRKAKNIYGEPVIGLRSIFFTNFVQIDVQLCGLVKSTGVLCGAVIMWSKPYLGWVGDVDIIHIFVEMQHRKFTWLLDILHVCVCVYIYTREKGRSLEASSSSASLEISCVFGTRRYIVVFSGAYCLSLFWATWVQSTS